MSQLLQIIGNIKYAERHAYERIKERTDLPTSVVDKIEDRVVSMGVPPGSYYVPISKKGNIIGYATLRTVGMQNKPVVTTVLGSNMKPRGILLYVHKHRSR